jgi:hypothetical protein
MRAETNQTKLEAFMAALGSRVRGEGCIYLTGDAFHTCAIGDRRFHKYQLI